MHVSEDLEIGIQKLGKEIFAEIGKEQPSAFDKKFWTGRIMEWSMSQPELKINMFRLVGVLPDLRSSASVARHVNEYLGNVGSSINGLVDWGLNVKPSSLRAKITSVVVKKSVQQMAAQFIAGESPQDALRALKSARKNGIAFTVDLLGEYCLSEKEAEAYLERYIDALTVFGDEFDDSSEIVEGHPGETSPICISVKLTALYSQCSSLNFDRSVAVLSERLAKIARKAREINALIYVDAEDTSNNPIISQTFKNVFGSQEFRDYPYPGLVLQAYAKESEETLDDLIKFSEHRGNPIAIRLVKGAYWDYETVISNQHGWESPLYSKKESSDANFEKLTRKLMDNHKLCLPAIGSHNIRSLTHACGYAEYRGLSNKDFEIQVLFGMADPIANAFAKRKYLVRSYVPLGKLIPGMGYLVRRLMENTSNESFLRQSFYESMDVEKLLKRPHHSE